MDELHINRVAVCYTFVNELLRANFSNVKIKSRKLCIQEVSFEWENRKYRAQVKTSLISRNGDEYTISIVLNKPCAGLSTMPELITNRKCRFESNSSAVALPPSSSMITRLFLCMMNRDNMIDNQITKSQNVKVAKIYRDVEKNKIIENGLDSMGSVSVKSTYNQKFEISGTVTLEQAIAIKKIMGV